MKYWCEFIERNGECVCKHCKEPISTEHFPEPVPCGVQIHRQCFVTDTPEGYVHPIYRQMPLPKPNERPKLGDWTEQQLKRIGVTQERYVEAKKRFGLAPSCNCASRKAWLNKVSDWWRNET